MKLKIISAGAGSGKTYRLTQEMVTFLKEGVRPSGIIATTFTTKAAAELQERVRVRLLEDNMVEAAHDLTNALIGTVHGLGVKLLKRFAFLAGVSPEVDIIADEDQQAFFNRSLASVLRVDRIKAMEQYTNVLGLKSNEQYDWRKEIKRLTDVARSNDFSIQTLEESKVKSFETFSEYLDPPAATSSEKLNVLLIKEIQTTIHRLEENEDSTKKTQLFVDFLKSLQRKNELGEPLTWGEWAKLSKSSVGSKSKEDVEDLLNRAAAHLSHPQFHQDIKDYLYTIFDIAIDAIKEYAAYKKERGLIDYIDMEIMVNHLLDRPEVKNILKEELDLLMVDEFQDTSPIQLEIFLKLSKIAQHSVWVGDPKQSIYGFRGAEPALMLKIIEKTGGIKKEDIQEYSWRSREDIVNLTNAIFTKSFKSLPNEQIALKAKRTKADNPEDSNFKAEPLEMKDALMHWHFRVDSDKKRTNKEWFNNSIANGVKKLLERQVPIIDRKSGKLGTLRAGDIAILCRTNYECLSLTNALHQAGIKAAIARTQLMNTAEAKLVMACLKYILHKSDSLSVAEILLLGEEKKLEEIIVHRLNWLEEKEENSSYSHWGNDHPIIQQLNELRSKAAELSSTEILNYVLELLNIRKISASWGNLDQRMDNIDMLRKYALQYEDNCNRLHSAASLGGFLLYLNQLNTDGLDQQGSGAGPDAVHILTYHRSKGLEWPLVICHNLENKLRDSLWGMTIQASSEEIDLDNVLANRWLRYWVNPYGKQYQKTVLSERISKSDLHTKIQQNVLEEEARLLYVGITRARDYLIFPSREGNATKWLNRCYHEGEESIPCLEIESSESIWNWEDKPIIMHPELMVFGKDFTVNEAEESALYYLEEQQLKSKHQDYLIDIKNYFKRGRVKARALKAIQYYKNFELPEPSQLTNFNRVLHQYLFANHPKRNNEQRILIAEKIIAQQEAEEFLTPKQLNDWSLAFYDFLSKHAKDFDIYLNYPLDLKKGNQLLKLSLDYVVETSKELLIFQHSSSSSPAKQYKKIAKEKAGELVVAVEALQENYPDKQVRTFVHFLLGATLVELEVKLKKREV